MSVHNHHRIFFCIIYCFIEYTSAIVRILTSFFIASRISVFISLRQWLILALLLFSIIGLCVWKPNETPREFEYFPRPYIKNRFDLFLFIQLHDQLDTSPILLTFLSSAFDIVLWASCPCLSSNSSSLMGIVDSYWMARDRSCNFMTY